MSLQDWVNRPKILSRRIRNLLVGDSLECPNSQWRVVCVLVSSTVRQYAVYQNGNRKFPVDKKYCSDVERVVDYILCNPEIPITLVLVEDGAIDEMTDPDDDLDSRQFAFF